MLKVYLAGEIHTNWREEIVENSHVTFPKFIGMGYENKVKLKDLFKKLFN